MVVATGKIRPTSKFKEPSSQWKQRIVENNVFRFVWFFVFLYFFPLPLHLLHWASRQKKKSYRPKCYWQSATRVTFTIECTDVKSLKMFQNSFPSVKIEVLSVLLTEMLINAPSFLSLTGRRAWKSVSSVLCPAGFILWTVSSISFCHVRGSESTAALRGKLNSVYDWMVSVVKLVFYLIVSIKVQRLFDWLLGVFVCFWVFFDMLCVIIKPILCPEI